MPLDDEKVKAALDDFEADKFLDAKDKLSAEIARARDEFLQKTLELKGEINPDPEEEEDETEEDDTEDDTEDEDDDSEEEDEEKRKRKERVKARLAAKEKENKDEE
jgi:hypothetical protein